MKLHPLVSIIMPVYNSEDYIREAINSVLNQSWPYWELLVVNDGSADNSEKIILSFNDSRIRYFSQTNKGVAFARNVALKVMQGDYFCFLDADDVLPQKSLEARIKVFKQNPQLSFVDGLVVYKDGSLNKTLRTYQPRFKGYPYKELVKVDRKCYFGLSWMIKREPQVEYTFKVNMTHAEDLYFYISISERKLYDYAKEEVLYYRISGKSAMANLIGLEDGYYKLYKNIKRNLPVTAWELVYLKLKLIRIMALSHCFDGKRPERSLKVFFRYLFA
jgi:teichuronic acid biosynthesis glycosyltransferase TuaG